ncbi:SSS family solute:Na+ symporter [Lederbergia galactosidilyticus]|uniref:solute:sodium symporter family transporter n=1 Tax=Lederbergia galactosidilytica TaxID=217031 RepID=UPI0009FB150F|nr:solute:sodium symporter family transporter [Lederbergia galactosidilytica]MBP1915446.1 SSS family solute:Na+ symporter [Lederbergia galactosidilytica]
MDYSNLIFTVTSCIIIMVLISIFTYFKSRGETKSSDGYFLAGRGLTGVFIAGSVLLTNLSAEQLIGLNGQAYRSNLSNMAWEVTAPIAIVIMALFLLPKYLGGAFTTLPEFLSKRFDTGVQQMTAGLFLLSYVFVLIPSTLYSGSLAVLQIFNVPELFNISYTTSIWVIVWIIGIIGSLLAVLGGAKAVAVSDTVYGIGLLIVGILVPVLGFFALGQGDMVAGMKHIAVNNPEKLNAIGSSADSVPFGAIFTGLIFANLFYFGTNQYIIQRSLGAKNLKEGQKGVLFSGFFKLAIPLFMMIPGTIAFHLYGGNLENVDLAYPTIVTNLLPTYLSGFFLAVLLGAVFSTYNSLLNSASTIFALDIYKKKINSHVTDVQMVKISKIFGLIVSIIALFITPLLLNAPNGIWDLIKQFSGFFNIPIIAIVLAGLIFKKVPAIAAKVVIIFHVTLYYLLVWGTEHLFGINLNINFIYVYGVLFFVEIFIMLVIGKFKPLSEPYQFERNHKVEMVPWKYTIFTSIWLISLVVLMYIVFSPIGFAYQKGIVSPMFLPVILILLGLTAVLSWYSINRWNEKYSKFLDRVA